MAASTNTESKNLNNWVDGAPSSSFQTGTSIPVGNLQFWIDGVPYANIFPSETTTTRTSDMMPFFWGI